MDCIWGCCQAHQKVFIKDVPFQKILPGGDQYLRTQQQPGGKVCQNADGQAKQHCAHPVQCQPQYKQNCPCHQRTKALLTVVGMCMAMAVFVVVMMVMVFVFMPVTVAVMAAAFRMDMPGTAADHRIRLHRADDLLEFRKKPFRILRREAQLPGGKNDRCLLYLRKSGNLSFHFCRTVGAAQIVNIISALFYSQPPFTLSCEQSFMRYIQHTPCFRSVNRKQGVLYSFSADTSIPEHSRSCCPVVGWINSSR